LREEDEDEEEHAWEKMKNLLVVVHCYIQWSCNLMVEIISETLGITKLTERINLTNGQYLRDQTGKF